jgi:hypothetical protein
MGFRRCVTPPVYDGSRRWIPRIMAAKPLSQRTWGAVSNVGGIDHRVFGIGRIVERSYRRG